MTLVAHGLVREDGQLKLDDRTAFVRGLPQFAGKRVTLTVEEEIDGYSDAQRRRFWLICQLVADIWNAGRSLEDKLSKDHAKYVLCRAYVGVVETPLGLVPKGIRGLSRQEMSEIQEKITADFASEGTPLPLDGIA